MGMQAKAGQARKQGAERQPVERRQLRELFSSSCHHLFLNCSGRQSPLAAMAIAGFCKMFRLAFPKAAHCITSRDGTIKVERGVSRSSFMI